SRLVAAAFPVAGGGAVFAQDDYLEERLHEDVHSYPTVEVDLREGAQDVLAVGLQGNQAGQNEHHGDVVQERYGQHANRVVADGQVRQQAEVVGGQHQVLHNLVGQVDVNLLRAETNAVAADTLHGAAVPAG